MAGPTLRGLEVLVTGATGFVGSAFVRHAVREGARVTILARASADRWRLAPVDGSYARLTGALESLATVPLDSPRLDVVVHCAAAGVDQTFDDVDELVATNVHGTLAALKLALARGAGRFVLLGSSGEYGPGVGLAEDAPLRPTSEYGATRASATLLARAFGARRGLDVTVVRPFAVFGPYEAAYRLVPYAICRGLKGEPIQISSGAQTRDYVFVEDVADGIARACVQPDAAGQVINLCSGRETAVRDIASMIAERTGGRSEVAAGARGEIPGEMWRTSGNPARARELLDWTARTGLAEGLARTIDWFRLEGAALRQYAKAAS
jgi:nucleoside-diphosphate-sugar epimerase